MDKKVRDTIVQNEIHQLKPSTAREGSDHNASANLNRSSLEEHYFGDLDKSNTSSKPESPVDKELAKDIQPELTTDEEASLEPLDLKPEDSRPKNDIPEPDNSLISEDTLDRKLEAYETEDMKHAFEQEGQTDEEKQDRKAIDMSDELDFSELDREIDETIDENSATAEEIELSDMNAEHRDELSLTEAETIPVAENKPENSNDHQHAPTNEKQTDKIEAGKSSTTEDSLTKNSTVEPNKEIETKQALSDMIASGKAHAARSRKKKIFAISLLALFVFAAACVYLYFIQSSNSSITTFSPDQFTAERSLVPSVSAEGAGAKITGTEGETAVSDGIDSAVGESVETNLLPADPNADAKTDNTAAEASSPNKASASGNKSNLNSKTADSAREHQPKPVQEPSEKNTESINGGSTSLSEKTSNADSTHQLLHHAYKAYKSGDYEAARRNYLGVIQRSPSNRDALLGMAALEIQANRPENSIFYYREVLKRAPLDNYAKAGLLSLSNFGDNIPKIESEVVTLLRENDDDAHLHFLLGNLRNEQNNWNAALRAYENALNLDKNNPDYAFNVAVTYDRLRQPEKALELYRQASVLSNFKTPSFSRASLATRIRELSDTTKPK